MNISSYTDILSTIYVHVPGETMQAAEITMLADYHDLFARVDFAPGTATCPLTSE